MDLGHVEENTKKEFQIVLAENKVMIFCLRESVQIPPPLESND